MKLLIYSHFFAPSIGGVETIVLSLARGLAELRDEKGASRLEVSVVTQTPAGRFNDRELPFAVIRQPSLLHLWKLIRSCDLLHIAGPALAPMILAFLARRPSIIEHHGYQAICPNGLLVHQPDGRICPGHFQAERYLECWRCQRSEISLARTCLLFPLMFTRYWLSRKAAANLAITRHVMERHELPHASVAYYGIDDPLRGVPGSTATDSRICFAFVGRFVPEKGLTSLIDAASILHNQGADFEVRLIGDGPLRSELEALIQQHGLSSRVRITGYLINEQLMEALRDVRVVVMPSVWEETAGLAAIEQMMRGRLVIASKIGGLAEVVGETGLTFPAGDARALAESMKLVLRDPSLIEQLGSKARDRALQLFRRERMIEEHACVYRGLSEGQKA